MKPFNLQEALEGKPVMLRNGSKAIIYANIEQYKVDFPLKGLVYTDDNTYDELEWTLEGDFYENCSDDRDIVYMWEEIRPTVTLTLPCPLEEPRDKMWYIDYKDIYPISVDEKGNITYLN